MLLRHEKAPSLQALRPFKATVSAGFPVYKDLVDDLVAGQQLASPSWRIAHVLGTCSGYAYSQRPTVAMIMARMGLDENYCAEIGEYVDAMFICSTAFLVQSKCGRAVILCYRGTEPVNFINWLTDLDVNPERVSFAFGNSGPFDVHAGFYRNVRATRHEVLNALQRALRREPIVEGAPRPEHPLEALYITGHSLGAAMAAVMGIMLSTEAAYAPVAAKLRAVYTFGQPMVGSPELAAACERHAFLSKNLVRFIYAQDLVPALPPTFSGDFKHFGAEHQFVTDRTGPGKWQLNPEPMRPVSNAVDLSLAGVSFIARQLRRFRNVKFRHSMDDHGPQHYIAALTQQNGVPSEFGDELAPSLRVAAPVATPMRGQPVAVDRP